jgi:hypothetical protein
MDNKLTVTSRNRRLLTWSLEYLQSINQSITRLRSTINLSAATELNPASFHKAIRRPPHEINQTLVLPVWHCRSWHKLRRLGNDTFSSVYNVRNDFKAYSPLITDNDSLRLLLSSDYWKRSSIAWIKVYRGNDKITTKGSKSKDEVAPVLC